MHHEFIRDFIMDFIMIFIIIKFKQFSVKTAIFILMGIWGLIWGLILFFFFEKLILETFRGHEYFFEEMNTGTLFSSFFWKNRSDSIPSHVLFSSRDKERTAWRRVVRRRSERPGGRRESGDTGSLSAVALFRAASPRKRRFAVAFRVELAFLAVASSRIHKSAAIIEKHV